MGKHTKSLSAINTLDQISFRFINQLLKVPKVCYARQGGVTWWGRCGMDTGLIRESCIWTFLLKISVLTTETKCNLFTVKYWRTSVDNADVKARALRFHFLLKHLSTGPSAALRTRMENSWQCPAIFPLLPWPLRAYRALTSSFLILKVENAEDALEFGSIPWSHIWQEILAADASPGSRRVMRAHSRLQTLYAPNWNVWQPRQTTGFQVH